jgi:putative ABC transport system ATP-binding protein
MRKALPASKNGGYAGHLRAECLRLDYRASGGEPLQPVLDIDLLEIRRGEQVAVTGPSGAGKTSLLYVLTGIQPPSSGRVDWDGTDLAHLSESARDAWRRENVGFIFQDFHLVPGMTVLQNVLLPSSFASFRPPREVIVRAQAMLERLGAPPSNRKVEVLSRGEQQRVALARALAHDPRIIVADEPTASLDAANASVIRDLLFQTSADLGLTMIVVSHDPRLLAASSRVLWLQDGRLGKPPAGIPDGRRAGGEMVRSVESSGELPRLR